jgi:hypothetical protein
VSRILGPQSQSIAAAADILSRELGEDSTWAAQRLEEFNQLAKGYLPA